MDTFLGQPITGGVNATMAQVLAAVEDDLWRTWKASPDEGDFHTWAGLVEPSIGTRPGDGRHATGAAVDLNVTECPYIVTRTGETYGGEAAAHDQQEMRRRVVEVYDRAVAFFTVSGRRSDTSIRVNDTIEVTYDRFRELSDALVFYLSWAVSAAHVRVNRPPIADAHALPDGHPALRAIPAPELAQPADAAIPAIEFLYADEFWAQNHQGWPYGPEQQYWQMLRDYETVRTPLLHGNPAQPITATRNPAHGFLQLRKELVCSLIHVGDAIIGTRRMRWGASDFGARESGDVMHFDLG
ncbi:hypothetical protein [Plantactinospora sp. DSM 117369]